MNSIEYTALFITGSATGFLVGWLIARSKFADRFSASMIENRSKIAGLCEIVRNKSTELNKLKMMIQRSEEEVKSLSQELFEISKERVAALSKLDQMSDLKNTIQEQKQEIANLNTTISDLRRRQAKLETIIAKERIEVKEKLALLEDIRNNMADSYKAISASALRENNQSFLDLAKTTLARYLDGAKRDFDLQGKELKDIVQPIKEALLRYDDQVRAMELSREQAYGGLSEQLNSLIQTQFNLQKETGKLVRALHVPHVRGRWGEITLKRVAEISGMMNQCDFFEQQSTSTKDGLMRPDMLVYLPGDRQIIVDAKVPLTAYLEALEAETDKERQGLLLTHSKHVQTHIQKLAQKEYWSQFQPTPEFVVLFIPGENFFSAALMQNPQLIEEGVKKNIIIATPTTLISLLKTIAFGWRQETITENARVISELGRELYERLCSMATHMNRLGRDIERCTTSYNQAVGSLEHRVFTSARKFKELGIYLSEDKDLLFIEPAEKKTRTVEFYKDS
ncbi:MAG: DNA recombination protein RmuC [Desulfobacterales bacterium]|nr:DNA recombination protein RmuC [Desulfobacterales bacterium]